MHNLNLPARLVKQIDLYDGKRYVLTFSSRNLELECPFRLQKWVDYNKYFKEMLANEEGYVLEIGNVYPCQGVVYEGQLITIGNSNQKIRHGLGRQIGDDGTVYYGTWQYGAKTGYAFI